MSSPILVCMIANVKKFILGRSFSIIQNLHRMKMVPKTLYFNIYYIFQYDYKWHSHCAISLILIIIWSFSLISYIIQTFIRHCSHDIAIWFHYQIFVNNILVLEVYLFFTALDIFNVWACFWIGLMKIWFWWGSLQWLLELSNLTCGKGFYEERTFVLMESTITCFFFIDQKAVFLSHELSGTPSMLESATFY